MENSGIMIGIGFGKKFMSLDNFCKIPCYEYKKAYDQEEYLKENNGL
jgi:hypothetical protein